jgi:hypothetical protein
LRCNTNAAPHSLDFDFVQDGTRRDAEFRLRRHHWYLEQLGRFHLSCLLAEGPLQARVDQIATPLESDARNL